MGNFIPIMDKFLTDTEYLEELGKRIEHMRSELKITQQDMAEHCGITRKTYRSIEKGQPISTLVLIRCLRKLGLQENILQLVPKQDTIDPFNI